MCTWCTWTRVSNCVLHFLTPTALVVFFLSCTPSGEAGTSPFEVLSSSRRAPSHSSLWSLSTLRAWPRFVYDTAGGTDGPTRRDIHMRTLLYTFQQKHIIISTAPISAICRRKRTDKDSVFVTTASSKATQSQDLDIIQSIKYNALQQHFFNKLYSYRSQGERVRSKAVPSSCFGVLFLRELQERQPASRWRQTQWSHMTWEEAATQPSAVLRLSH